METKDWADLVEALGKVRDLVEKGGALELEGYWHGIKWGQAAYEVRRLTRALEVALDYEHPGEAILRALLGGFKAENL